VPDGAACGPLVDRRQLGFEHLKPTRLASGSLREDGNGGGEERDSNGGESLTGQSLHRCCQGWAAIIVVMSATLRTMKASLVLIAVLTLACGCASHATWYAANALSLRPEAECARNNGIWHVQLNLCEAQGK
jgi:hypothetical protein